MHNKDIVPYIQSEDKKRRLKVSAVLSGLRFEYPDKIIRLYENGIHIAGSIPKDVYSMDMNDSKNIIEREFNEYGC